MNQHPETTTCYDRCCVSATDIAYAVRAISQRYVTTNTPPPEVLTEILDTARQHAIDCPGDPDGYSRPLPKPDLVNFPVFPDNPDNRLAIRLAHFVREHGANRQTIVYKRLVNSRNKHRWEDALRIACEQGWVTVTPITVRPNVHGRLISPVGDAHLPQPFVVRRRRGWY